MQLIITQQFINLMDLTSRDEVTPTLSGIYFNTKDHKAVATDGHALNTIALPEKWDLESIVKFKPFKIKKNHSAIFDIDKKMIYEIKLITNNSNIQVFENGVDGYQITKTIPVEVINIKENPLSKL